MQAHAVSVVILTLNEEANLPDCLASLRGLPCDVFVVDSGSVDRTLEIAKSAGATVVEHQFEDYGRQRNWAIDNLPLRSAFELHLDADERLTPELVEEITTLLRAPPREVDGWMLRKRTVFLGRWIRHGGHYPSYHLRLFRRGKGRCEERAYDQHFLVKGQVSRLKRDYIDILTPDLDRYVDRHRGWAKAEAHAMLEAANAPGRVRSDAFGNAIEHKRWLRTGVYARAPLLLRPFLYWAYRYFIRLGFLDGKEGAVFHFMQGLWYRFLVDVEILRLKGALGRSPR